MESLLKERVLPKNGSTFADNDKSLLISIIRVDVTDGSAGELKWKLTVATR